MNNGFHARYFIKEKSVSDMIIVLNNRLLVIETRRSDNDTSASVQKAGSKACMGDDKRSARPVESTSQTFKQMKCPTEHLCGQLSVPSELMHVKSCWKKEEW